MTGCRCTKKIQKAPENPIFKWIMSYPTPPSSVQDTRLHAWQVIDRRWTNGHHAMCQRPQRRREGRRPLLGAAELLNRKRKKRAKGGECWTQWNCVDLNAFFLKAANGKIGKTIMTSHNFSGHDWKECPVCYFRGHCGDMLAFLSNECLFEECKSHESQW